MLIATPVLGQAEPAVALEILNHGVVPFRSKPVYLRLATTRARVLDYAASGFHVSVTRGQAGGCSDPAAAVNGSRGSACSSPLGRDDLRRLWAAAAAQYQAAYAAGTAGAQVPDLVPLLQRANALADVAYGQENVEPPRDPVTQAPEAPMASLQGESWAHKGLAVATLAAGAALITGALTLARHG